MEQGAAEEQSLDTVMDMTDNSMTNPGVRLDGSLIDLTESDDGTNIAGVPVQANIDGTVQANIDGTYLENMDGTFPVNMDGTMPLPNVHDPQMNCMDVEGEVGEALALVDEVAEEQIVDDSLIEEPLTPATDNTGSTKSQPGSGRVTPASQSDQSVTFSSSEKSTPSRRFKASDMQGRQIEFDNVSTSSGSVKNVPFPLRQGIHWRKGERLEAMDYLNSWFPAKIKEIRDEDAKVLIHFDGWNQRYDEWIDMNSDRIRPLVRHSGRKVKPKQPKGCPLFIQSYKVGDQVYAKWTDCKMYPAKVTNVLPNGSYEVIFYDGFKKLVQPINLRPMPGENKSFEIHPVPDVVLKKVKMKLDTTSIQPGMESPEERSRSVEKLNPSRDSSVETEKRRIKRKRQATFDGADLASIVNSLENGPADVMPHIKSEPVSTQTDYSENKTGAELEMIGEGAGLGTVLPVPAVAGISGTSGPAPLLPPKAFVVQSDHNPYKCTFEGCTKGFRKEHLLDYHIKYYHMTEGEPPLPPKRKKRRKTISTCSTESDFGHKKSAAKKNRNLSAESAIYEASIKQEPVDTGIATNMDTGEISTQTSPSKHVDPYASEDSNLGIKTEIKFEPKDGTEDSSVTDAEDYLKPDELVNCICDFQEENGLMIQCEVCMCWQHAACFGITERTLPKTYICFVCENPPGVRESSKYIHEQDWFKTGEIASFNYLPLPAMSEETCSTVKATHTLVAEIHQLNTVLHSLKLQLHILRTKDESKLRQWKIDWDVMEQLHETMETCPTGDDYSIKSDNGLDESKGDYSGNIGDNVDSKGGNLENQIKVELDTEKEQVTENVEGENTETIIKEESSLNTEVKNEVNTPETPEEKVDETVNNSDETNVNGSSSDAVGTVGSNEHDDGVNQSESVAAVNNATFTEKGPSEDVTEVSEETQEKGVYIDPEEGMHSDSTESVIEDPREVCEKNLISHILRVQAEISDRLDKIEEEVTMLEAMEACQARKPRLDSQHILGDMPQLKRSMKNLCSDLTKVKKMAVFH